MASLPPHRRRRHFRSWGSRTASAGRADFGGSLPEFPRWLSWANVELRLAEAVARSVSEVSCRGCRRVTGCETNDWGYTLAETLMDVEEKKNGARRNVWSASKMTFRLLVSLIIVFRFDHSLVI